MKGYIVTQVGGSPNGPFSDRAAADQAALSLIKAGYLGVSIRAVGDEEVNE